MERNNGYLTDHPPGATPLSAEDIDGLIPDLATRDELNAWEQQNILQAMDRLRRRRPREILDDGFLRKLLAWMFGETWKWAGEYRLRETNIGSDPAHIAVHVRELCDNVRYQRDNRIHASAELAIRFHRELV